VAVGLALQVVGQALLLPLMLLLLPLMLLLLLLLLHLPAGPSLALPCLAGNLASGSLTVLAACQWLLQLLHRQWCCCQPAWAAGCKCLRNLALLLLRPV
jgi:hypothetical protein